MKVSILMLTIDRFELTSRVWKHNLAAARYKLDRSIELECLICDNGSRDRRIVDFYRPHSNPTIAYHRVNGINEGVGKAFNQLYLRSTGKFIAILGNDIEMPNGWLNRAALPVASTQPFRPAVPAKVVTTPALVIFRIV